MYIYLLIYLYTHIDIDIMHMLYGAYGNILTNSGFPCRLVRFNPHPRRVLLEAQALVSNDDLRRVKQALDLLELLDADLVA